MEKMTPAVCEDSWFLKGKNLKQINMDKFIITTTPTIEGHPIRTYLGAINVNIVIGTNFFSDFAASFTDVFGGNSGTYQRKMDDMYESAKKELEKKAIRMGELFNKDLLRKIDTGHSPSGGFG